LAFLRSGSHVRGAHASILGQRGDANRLQPYYFTIVSKGNHKTLVTSETYTSKEAAINGMQAVVEALNEKPLEYDEE